MKYSANVLFSVGSSIRNDCTAQLYLDTCYIFNFPISDEYDVLFNFFKMMDDGSEKEIHTRTLNQIIEETPELGSLRELASAWQYMTLRLRFSNSMGLYLLKYPEGTTTNDVKREDLEYWLFDSMSKEQLQALLKECKI